MAVPGMDAAELFLARRFISDLVSDMTANGAAKETIFKIIRMRKYFLDVVHNNWTQ